MHIKPGVDAKAAAATIDGAIEASGAEGLCSDYDAVLFTDWVHGLERTLRESFVDVPTDRLYTEPFWRAQGPILYRKTLVSQEVERQVAWLSDVRDTVSSMSSRFAVHGRSILVLDTARDEIG